MAAGAAGASSISWVVIFVTDWGLEATTMFAGAVVSLTTVTLAGAAGSLTTVTLAGAAGIYPICEAVIDVIAAGLWLKVIELTMSGIVEVFGPPVTPPGDPGTLFETTKEGAVGATL